MPIALANHLLRLLLCATVLVFLSLGAQAAEDGIMLTLVTPDQRIVQEPDIALCSIERMRNSSLSYDDIKYRRLPDGRFWIPAKADLKAFNVAVGRGLYRKVVTTAEWRFTTTEPIRALTLTVPPLHRVAIRICDARGRPLPNSKLGDVDLTFPGHGQLPPSRTRLTGQATDAEGKLILGLLGEGKPYQLLVYTADGKGILQSFAVNATGEADPPDYRASRVFRDVKQRVFTKAGMPAANQPMHLSVCWNGRIILRDAVTDANGEVTWTAVPPAPAMVWGPGIQVGELPEDAVSIREPLPASELTKENYFESACIFTLNTAVGEPGWRSNDTIARWSTKYAIKGLSIYIPPCGCSEHIPISPAYEEAPANETPKRERYDVVGGSVPGEPVNILLWSLSYPTRYAMLTDFYLPRGPGTLEVPLCEPIIVRLRLRTPDGQPVQVLNPFQILPDGDTGLAHLLNDFRAGEDPLPSHPLGNGEYEVVLPCAGAYRLCIDGYPRTAPAPPALKFTVTAHPDPVTITMPEPIAVVPPGTEIYCLSLASPMKPYVLTAPLGAEKTPVYADRSRLLAYWYRVKPDVLTRWVAADGEAPAREFQLRQITLTARFDDEYHIIPLLLLPLFPGQDNPMADRPQQPGDALLHAMSLTADIPVRIYVWPGEYVIYRQQDRLPLASFVITPTDPPADTLTIELPPEYKALLQEAGRRHISMQLPVGTTRAAIRNSLQVQDSTGFYQASISPVDFFPPVDRLGISLEVPPAVKSLTIQNLGVGVIRNLDVSHGDNIVLPAWQPGVPCSGVVMGYGEKPYTGKLIVLTPDGISTVVATNAAGHVSIPGVLPGRLLLKEVHPNRNTTPNDENVDLEGRYGSRVWQLDIPAAGVTDFKLSEPELRVSEAYREYAQRLDAPLWLFPVRGPAVYFTVKHDTVDASITDGWIWEMKGQHGFAYQITADNLESTCPSTHYSAYTWRKEAGVNPIDMQTSPSFGIILPYKAGATQPGAITLTGLKERAGASLHLAAPEWVVNPMLGCIYTTLFGIPPGEYRLRILVKDTIIDRTVTVTEGGGYFQLAGD